MESWRCRRLKLNTKQEIRTKKRKFVPLFVVLFACSHKCKLQGRLSQVFFLWFIQDRVPLSPFPHSQGNSENPFAFKHFSSGARNGSYGRNRFPNPDFRVSFPCIGTNSLKIYNQSIIRLRIHFNQRQILFSNMNSIQNKNIELKNWT